VGGSAIGNSAGVSMLASSTAPSALSMASGVGSFFETGKTGATERRFPHRVRTILDPSVKTLSPACNVSGFFVQKMAFPMR
jgi:hypothetical protein